MTALRRSVLTLALVIGAGAVASLASAGSGGVTGVVLGPGGEGLAGAEVTLRRAADGAATVLVTGEGGEFRRSGLEPARYELETRLAGFVDTGSAEVDVAADRVTRVEVVLASLTFAAAVEVRAASRLDSLEAAELEGRGDADLGQALARVPGVWKVRRGGIANDVVVRGFREDDVAVLVDGARVAGACPNRMDPPAFHLDFAEVERVEVGSAAGQLAAQGALGGLVSVVTRQPEPGLHAEVAMVGGSFGLSNPSATASYRGRHAAVLVGGSSRSSEPYRDGSGERMTAAANYSAAAEGEDAYQVGTAWGRFYLLPGDGHELELSYSRQEADGVLYPGLRMDAVFDDTDRLTLGYRHAPQRGWLRSVAATAYATGVDHWMDDSLRSTGAGAPRGWAMGTRAETRMTGLNLVAESSSLAFGVEAYRREWDAWTEMAGMGYMRQFSIPNVDMEVVGASASWRRDLGARTRLELGGRFDRVDSVADPSLANTDLYLAYHGTRATDASFADPSFSALLAHQLGHGLGLRAGVSRSVRPPDPRELFFALKRQGSDWVGNPGLEAPRDTRAALGATWDLGVGVVTADVWYDRVDDYVTVYDQQRLGQVPGVMNPVARSYANVDAELVGAALQATAAVSSSVSLAASAAYVRGSKDARPELGLSAGPLAEMPPLSGRLAVRWQRRSVFGEAEVVVADDQDRVDADLGETATPGWAALNLSGGVSLGQWRLRALLGNAFDRTYREHFSYQRDPFRSGYTVNEPGRSFAVTLGWSG